MSVSTGELIDAPAMESGEVAVAEPDNLANRKELVEFRKQDVIIGELLAKCRDLKVVDVDDKDGYKAVRSARLELKDKRILVEKGRQALKAGVLEYGRLIDGEAKRLTSMIEPEESRLEKMEEAIDAAKERRKREAEEAKRRVLQERLDQLASLGVIANSLVVATWDDATFIEQRQKAEAEYRERKAAEAERLRLEEERRKAEAAEAARLAEIERAERAERDRKAAEEAARLKAEAERLAEIERKQREERERLDAQVRRLAEEAAALERQRREAAELEVARLKAIEAERVRQEKAAEAERVRREQEAEVSRLRQEQGWMEHVNGRIAEESAFQAAGSASSVPVVEANPGIPAGLVNPFETPTTAPASVDLVAIAERNSLEAVANQIRSIGFPKNRFAGQIQEILASAAGAVLALK